MVIVSFLVFAVTFAACVMVFATTLVPALPRIAALLRGEADPELVERPMLVLSDRRVHARVRPVQMATRPVPNRAAA